MIVLLILLCVVGLVVRKMVKDKKAGRTCGSCGGKLQLLSWNRKTKVNTHAIG